MISTPLKKQREQKKWNLPPLFLCKVYLADSGAASYMDGVLLAIVYLTSIDDEFNRWIQHVGFNICSSSNSFRDIENYGTAQKNH